LNPQTEAFCELLGIENKINENGLRTAFMVKPKENTIAPETSSPVTPDVPAAGGYDPSMPPVN
jgi:pyridoxine 5'-phosphate synthase PdxJ